MQRAPHNNALSKTHPSVFLSDFLPTYFYAISFVFYSKIEIFFYTTDETMWYYTIFMTFSVAPVTVLNLCVWFTCGSRFLCKITMGTEFIKRKSLHIKKFVSSRYTRVWPFYLRIFPFFCLFPKMSITK